MPNPGMDFKNQVGGFKMADEIERKSHFSPNWVYSGVLGVAE